MNGADPGPFERIRAVLRALPEGEVASYGEIAARAGFPRGARTVVWVLKDAERHGLPWHRVVRRDRRIAITDPEGKFLQQKLLEAEGWRVGDDGRLARDGNNAGSR